MSETNPKDAAPAQDAAAPAPEAGAGKPKVSDTPVADSLIENTDRVHVRIPRY
ncbi:MAG: hypothetical protein LBQ12_02065 [Deltaproteobacteria bacterium]|jgi:hypothetical protein|nr:hypothetical protein [Deltaproteobacteria bacterium]